MLRPLTLLVASFLLCPRLPAKDLPPPPQPEAIAQKPLGENACGPCSLYHALSFGGPAERAAAKRLSGQTPVAQIASLIEAHGRSPSDAYPEGPRYREAEGMCDRELLGMTRDFLAKEKLKAVEGGYFDRTKEEAPGVHLRTVHAQLKDSLDAGFPPLVMIRSFAAEVSVSKEKNTVDHTWSGLGAHWVAVVSVPETLPPGSLGFAMRVADSWTGTVTDCFIHEEQHRNFVAAKGDTVTYTWPKIPRAFLVATVPALSLHTQKTPWYLRTNVVLSYGICRPKGS